MARTPTAAAPGPGPTRVRVIFKSESKTVTESSAKGGGVCEFGANLPFHHIESMDARLQHRATQQALKRRKIEDKLTGGLVLPLSTSQPQLFHTSNCKKGTPLRAQYSGKSCVIPPTSLKGQQIGNSSVIPPQKERKCPLCKQLGDYSGDAICEECGDDFGCTECNFESGIFCGKCEEYFCSECDDNAVIGCDKCFQMLCRPCGRFKPGEDRTIECYDCQPNWKKRIPADCLCAFCGSSKPANFCEDCDSNVCDSCPGFSCTSCGDGFACEDCQEGLGLCFECDEYGVCGNCCECSKPASEGAA